MSIQDRIGTAILPWRTCTDKPPPYTCAELVVIALVLNEKPMTDLGICLWVWSSFAFYAEIGVTGMWKYWDDEVQPREHDPLNSHRRLRPSGFQRVLHRYDVPAKAVDDGNDAEDGHAGKEKAKKWTVDHSEALLFLRPRLWPDEQPVGSFPFLRLPPEIRNIIYDTVFAFPPSGIQIDYHEMDGGGPMYAASRSFDEPFSFALWKDRSKLLDAGRVSQTLSLLAVNRQIRSEALYIFAKVNTFYFSTSSHMFSILGEMSAQHRGNIRSLAFTHSPGGWNSRSLVRAFAIMATMKRLRTLRIFIDQEEWRRYYHFYPNTQPIDHMSFDRAAKIDEFVKVILEGDWPREVENQIRSEPLVEVEELAYTTCAPLCRAPAPRRYRLSRIRSMAWFCVLYHRCGFLAMTWTCVLIAFILSIH